MLGIKDHDLSPFNACKSCKSSLTGISACGSQDHDLPAGTILLRRRCHKIRKNGKSHILKSDRRAVKQFQVPCVTGFSERRYLVRIKLFVISAVDTVLQFLLRIIRKKKAHDFISHTAVVHFREVRKSCLKGRDKSRNVETSILGESPQDRLGGGDRRTV